MPKRTRLYIAGLAGLGLIILVTYYKYGSRNSSISGPQDCFFCDFAHHRPSSRGPNPNLEVETEDYVIFKDKYPAAQHHYLAIPKEHLESFSVLNRSHLELVQRMELGMIELFRSKNLDPDEAILGFHIPPFISVKHLHLHGIYPPSDMSFLNKINFLPSFWFKKVFSETVTHV
ncbi:hypothetical protein KR032_002012 [Drosophila birchii]|nr:hypothetical protein KR032_002012 [Drosophila birchii]